MRVFVKFMVFDIITGDAEVRSLRQAARQQFKKIQDSGKLVEGGMFAGKRGGFLLLEVNSPADLNDILGGVMLDNFHIDTYGVMSFEDLEKFFNKEAGY